MLSEAHFFFYCKASFYWALAAAKHYTIPITHVISRTFHNSPMRTLVSHFTDDRTLAYGGR